jgi:hypothetical protein
MRSSPSLGERMAGKLLLKCRLLHFLTNPTVKQAITLKRVGF